MATYTSPTTVPSGPQVRSGRQSDHRLGRQRGVSTARRPPRGRSGRSPARRWSRRNALCRQYTELNGDDEPLRVRRRRDLQLRARRSTAPSSPSGSRLTDDGNVFYVGLRRSGRALQRGHFNRNLERANLNRGRSAASPSIPTAAISIVRPRRRVDCQVTPSTSSGRVLQAGPPCNSSCEPTATFGAAEVTDGTGMAIDPSTGDLYVDEGARILRFNSGRAADLRTGHGSRPAQQLEQRRRGRRRLGVCERQRSPVAPTSPPSAPLTLAPDAADRQSGIVDAVNDAGTRHTADFQVTPSGERRCVLRCDLRSPASTTEATSEIFRYDSAR